MNPEVKMDKLGERLVIDEARIRDKRQQADRLERQARSLREEADEIERLAELARRT